MPLLRDARGLESQLAVNHVGHFRLFARLLPALRRARGARVIALSSRGHVRSAFDFDDPSFEHRPYDKMIAYGQSKTANIPFLPGQMSPLAINTVAYVVVAVALVALDRKAWRSPPTPADRTDGARSLGLRC